MPLIAGDAFACEPNGELFPGSQRVAKCCRKDFGGGLGFSADEGVWEIHSYLLSGFQPTVYARRSEKRSGTSSNRNQNCAEVGDVAREFGAAGAEHIGRARRERTICAYDHSLNCDARSGAEAGPAGARSELRHLEERGGAGGLGGLDGELEILRTVFVDDDEVERSGRSFYSVGSDVEAANAGKTRGVKRALAGKREEENAAILGPGFDNRAAGVGDGRVAVTIAAAVVAGVALGDAEGNADALCAGVEGLEIADERGVGRDQVCGG